MNDDDLQLISQCRRGEAVAFDALYAAHAGRVKGYFLRSGFGDAAADDCTQETFVRAFRSLATYTASRGAFRTWLGAIARNVTRKQWSRRTAPEAFDPELVAEMFAGAENPGETAEAREETDAVRDCVDALDDPLRRIVRLRYVEGRTTRSIADAVDLPEATVRSRLDSARDEIRRCLGSKGILE
jgi:RNA polymerase sigma-70 factor, ECF subfamily